MAPIQSNPSIVFPPAKLLNELFFSDLKPSSSRSWMEKSIRKIMSKWGISDLSDDLLLPPYHSLRCLLHDEHSQAVAITHDDESYKLMLDVRDCVDDSVSVKVVGENELVIEGFIERKGEKATSSSISSSASIYSRKFQQRFIFPGLSVDCVASAISSDGILIVTAPTTTPRKSEKTPSLNKTCSSDNSSQSVIVSEEPACRQSSVEKDTETNTPSISISEVKISKSNVTGGVMLNQSGNSVSSSIFTQPDRCYSQYEDQKQSLSSVSSRNYSPEPSCIITSPTRSLSDQDFGITSGNMYASEEVETGVRSTTPDASEGTYYHINSRTPSNFDDLCPSMTYTWPVSSEQSEVSAKIVENEIRDFGANSKSKLREVEIPIALLDSDNQKEEQVQLIKAKISQILEKSKSENTVQNTGEEVTKMMQSECKPKEHIININFENDSSANTSNSKKHALISYNEQCKCNEIETKISSTSKNLSENDKSNDKCFQESFMKTKQHNCDNPLKVSIQKISENITTKQTPDYTDKDLEYHQGFTLPIIKRGELYGESFFKDSREHFHTAVKEVLNKWAQFPNRINKKTSNNILQDAKCLSSIFYNRSLFDHNLFDDLACYRNLRQRSLTKDTQAGTAKSDQQNFTIVVDVRGVGENCLSVLVVSDTEVCVEGHMDKNYPHTEFAYTFSKTFVLPSSIIEAAVSSALSSDGILTITAPKKCVLPTINEEWQIPVYINGQ